MFVSCSGCLLVIKICPSPRSSWSSILAFRNSSHLHQVCIKFASGLHQGCTLVSNHVLPRTACMMYQGGPLVVKKARLTEGVLTEVSPLLYHRSWQTLIWYSYPWYKENILGQEKKLVSLNSLGVRLEEKKWLEMVTLPQNVHISASSQPNWPVRRKQEPTCWKYLVNAFKLKRKCDVCTCASTLFTILS